MASRRASLLLAPCDNGQRPSIFLDRGATIEDDAPMSNSRSGGCPSLCCALLALVVSGTPGCARYATKAQTVAEVRKSPGVRAFDLYTSYRAQSPSGLNAVFQQTDGDRIEAGCSYLRRRNGQVRNVKCEWYVGGNGWLYAVMPFSPEVPDITLVMSFKPDLESRRLVLTGSGIYQDTADGLVLQAIDGWGDHFSMHSGVMLANGDELLGDKLTRAATSAAPAAAASSDAAPSVEERLQRLETLKGKGLLTDAEYELKRKEIVDSL